MFYIYHVVGGNASFFSVPSERPSQSIWGKSAWDGWDANARLSATGLEEMAQVVVGDAFHDGWLRGAVN